MADTMHTVKIFYDSGWSGLERLQREINEWFDSHEETEIISLTPTMCTVGSVDGELYQGMSIVVHYREAA